MNQFSKKASLWGRFIIWRYKNITGKQFLYILSAFIGFISGVGSVILKWFVHLSTSFLDSDAIDSYHKFYFFIFPLIGLLIVYFVKEKLIQKEIGAGIPVALFSLARRKGIMKRYQTYASLILAPITISFGGSVGLEAPAAVTSSALSSRISQWFRIDVKNRKLLLVCAAAASLSAIFKAPIAAIVFAIEVFSLDLTLASLMPLLIASISAILTRLIFTEEESFLIHFNLVEDFQLDQILLYSALGIFTAFISLYFTQVYFKSKQLFATINTPLKKVFIGGIVVGILIYIIPPLYGEGFGLINNLINNKKPELTSFQSFQSISLTDWGFIILLFVLILVKPIATSSTLHAGGIGGIFGPTLFIGASAGNFVAHFFNKIGFDVSISNFTLLGMCGLMAGVLHAPLTAIFLIAEITGGYDLFIPLMLVSAISFGITRYYVSYSVYTKELAEKGDLITHNKDQAVLTTLDVRSVIENNFIPIHPEMTLGEMLKNGVAHSNRNIFPVINDKRQFLGIILLDDIRHIMFDQTMYDTVNVQTFMHEAPEVIFLGEDSMEKIMKKFEQSKAWNLPVVKKDLYIGFISRSKLLTAYREHLVTNFDN
ncbi:putative chloride channel protein ClcB [Flavobacteriaceae bacterium UJ101]|nr:putative chloride channel protein ClcB [Flavobacteriaceae bacterium UJ101]